jgi:hypothetical protein
MTFGTVTLNDNDFCMCWQASSTQLMINNFDAYEDAMVYQKLSMLREFSKSSSIEYSTLALSPCPLV